MVPWTTQTHSENTINTFSVRSSFYLQDLWKEAETLSLLPSQMGALAGACADIWLCKLVLKRDHKLLLDKRLPLSSNRSDQHQQASVQSCPA